MNKEGIIGIAIYLACDKTKKTKRKKRFWMKEWFKKRNTFSHHNLITYNYIIYKITKRQYETQIRTNN